MRSIKFTAAWATVALVLSASAYAHDSSGHHHLSMEAPNCAALNAAKASGKGRGSDDPVVRQALMIQCPRAGGAGGEQQATATAAPHNTADQHSDMMDHQNH